MGYYNICLSKETSRLCEIILLWESTGTHAYLWGIVTPGIFKEKISKMFHVFEFIRHSLTTY